MTIGEAIGWGNIAEGAVKAGGIIMVDELAYCAFGVIESKRGFGADGLLFESAMEAFELAVALGVMRRAKDVGGLPEADEALEVASDKLGAAVGDDAGLGLWMCLAGALEDDLGIALVHLRADVPGDDGARQPSRTEQR